MQSFNEPELLKWSAQKTKKTTRLTEAVEAIRRLTLKGLNDTFLNGQTAALAAHAEIEVKPVSQRLNVFYRHFLPFLTDLVTVLAENYRRYFKLAIAHPHHAESGPDQWAWNQLQPAPGVALEWIREWHILACDGESQFVRRMGSTAVVTGQTASVPLTPPSFPPREPWRAPAWLFQIGSLVGIGALKDKHVPAADSEEGLGAAHTRLLLKGARRVFLRMLAAAIENAENEETAAAGRIQAHPKEPGQTGELQKPKHWLKGVVGLVRKANLSQYMHNLTEKQQLAASLKWEYGLGLTEIASRMGIDRKTAYGHIEAAERRIDQARSADKRRRNQSKITPE